MAEKQETTTKPLIPGLRSLEEVQATDPEKEINAASTLVEWGGKHYVLGELVKP